VARDDHGGADVKKRHFAYALLAFYLYAAFTAGALALRHAWTAPTWREPIVVRGRTLSAPMPLLIRAATSPVGSGWLDGREIATAYGPVSFARERPSGRLVVRCAPCRLSAPEVGARPLDLAAVTLTVARADDHLAGEASVGAVTIGWHGRLRDDGLEAHFAMPETPLAAALSPLAAELPELAYARLDGTVALRGTYAWPRRELTLTPQLRGLAVAGLGTDRLRRPVPLAGCSTVPRVGSGPAWRRLGAAVVAAEDQRYYEHPGYDLEEMRLALAANASAGRATRGASTISQQLARMVYAGADRELVRKVRELLYAVEMERTLGKARILDLYLAMAPWGSGGCGAQAAARTMYGRPLERLQIPELARLAAGLRDDERWRDVGNVVQVARAMRSITRTERTDAIASLCTGSVAADCVARDLQAAR
jgi:monofunctional glycosyltransferase